MLLSSFLDSPRARRFLHCLIVAASVAFAVFFLYASLKRMVYPFELERVESGVLISMLRALHGQPIYVAPTVDYVPYLYAPVFYYLAAALTKITGIAGHGYAADRLLSILATIGSAACIYGLTLTTTRRRIAGIAAAGLFFACYPVLDTFYDVGRVDSLVVFFLLLALLLQRRGYPILAAVVWAIAFQTKQSVLPIGIVILCAEWPRRKQVFLSLATLLGLAAISVMLMNHAAHGWYNFYLFHIAGALPFLVRQATLFFPQMLEPMAVAWAILFAAIILTLKTPLGAAGRFFAIVSIVLYGMIWFVASHAGASKNALIPLFAWTAVLFGIAFARLLDYAESTDSSRATTVILGAVAVQLLALLYNPRTLLPNAEATQALQRVVAQVQALPGDVYVFDHNYDAVMAGKPPHAEGEALHSFAGPISQHLEQDLDQQVAAHRYTAIAIDDAAPDTSWRNFRKDYPLAVSLRMNGFYFPGPEPRWLLFPCDVSPATLQALSPQPLVIDYGTCKPPQP